MGRLFTVIAIIGMWGAGALAAEGDPGRLNYMVPVAAESEEQRPMIADFIFADGSGMPQHLSQYRGQVVILNFWATWCGPCIKEMVFLNRLQQTFRGVSLTVIAISEDLGGLPVVKTFLSRQNFSWLKPFYDPNQAVAASLGIRGLPTSIIVDKHGRQFLRVEGPYQWDSKQIEDKLKKLLVDP